jgi:hypothetical protein
MSLFRKKRPVTDAENTVPEENTEDRHTAMLTQQEKLRRSRELKRRSAAVASTLKSHDATNHYIQRLELAFGKGH